MTVTQTGRRMALVGLLALIGAILPLSGVSAQDGDLTLDLEGETNVDYAIAWSQQAYPPAALDDADETNDPERAFIGRDDLFADNLSSGALQNTGPLLLTATGALSANTEIELERLGVEDVTILGNADAVDPAVEAELTELGYNVDRLGGLTRIETAIAIAAEDAADTTAILARAYESTEDGTQAFADSLAAGAWAAEDGYDVLLTQTEVLTGNTADYLEAAGYEQVIIVGGTMAVSQEVEDAVGAIGPDVVRVAGATRFETAIEIANARGFETSADANVTLLVDGQADDSWADGFPAANLASLGDYPVVLANSADTNLPEATTEFLVDDGVDNDGGEGPDTLDNVDLICGSSVPDEGGNDQCQEAADETGTEVAVVELRIQIGTITEVDTTNDTVTFIPEGETDPVTVDFVPGEDTFVVDGVIVTAEEFEEQADPGDTIAVIDNADGSQTFGLSNQDGGGGATPPPPTDPVFAGVVGNVDLAQLEYDIIDLATGDIINENISFAGDLFTVDGTEVTATVFIDDINEGDTVTVVQDTALGTDTHNLTNVDRTGTVADLATGGPGLGSTTQFTIDGVLGDDPLGGQDDVYEASFAPSPGVELYYIDGVLSTYGEFAAAINDGDTITYRREADIETFRLA
ncbi:hypothetical protein BH24ACT15_BH24ACT15_37150 [soil metagenome]